MVRSEHTQYVPFLHRQWHSPPVQTSPLQPRGVASSRPRTQEARPRRVKTVFVMRQPLSDGASSRIHDSAIFYLGIRMLCMVRVPPTCSCFVPSWARHILLGRARGPAEYPANTLAPIVSRRANMRYVRMRDETGLSMRLRPSIHRSPPPGNSEVWPLLSRSSRVRERTASAA